MNLVKIICGLPMTKDLTVSNKLKVIPIVDY